MEKAHHLISYAAFFGLWDSGIQITPSLTQLAATNSKLFFFLTGKSQKLSKLLQHLKCNPAQKTSSRQFISRLIVQSFFYKPDYSEDKINSRAKHCPETRSRCRPMHSSKFCGS